MAASVTPALAAGRHRIIENVRLLDVTLATPAENLALDEALLLDAEAGEAGETLRYWELPSHAVVLGSAGRVAEEADQAACAADGVPIVRRCSGGGAVVLGPGCLCYTLVLAMTRPGLADVRASYRRILSSVANALESGVVPEGCSDLAIGGRKVSGNSQRRLRHYLLHHGTLLHHFDLDRIARYLPQPVRQPSYRENRPHVAFVTNLAIDAVELRRRLASAWHAMPEDLARMPTRFYELLKVKYQSDSWTWRL